MSQQVTIRSVAPNGAPWSNDYGTFHPFTLTVDETNQPIEVNRKPDSPLLEVGQQVWVETKPGRDGALRGKIVQPPDAVPSLPTANGVRTLGGGGDDVTRASIESQVCLKAAVEYACGFSQPPDAESVVMTAKRFYAALREMQS